MLLLSRVIISLVSVSLVFCFVGLFSLVSFASLVSERRIDHVNRHTTLESVPGELPQQWDKQLLQYARSVSFRAAAGSNGQETAEDWRLFFATHLYSRRAMPPFLLPMASAAISKRFFQDFRRFDWACRPCGRLFSVLPFLNLVRVRLSAWSWRSDFLLFSPCSLLRFLNRNSPLFPGRALRSCLAILVDRQRRCPNSRGRNRQRRPRSSTARPARGASFIKASRENLAIRPRNKSLRRG